MCPDYSDKWKAGRKRGSESGLVQVPVQGPIIGAIWLNRLPQKQGSIPACASPVRGRGLPPGIDDAQYGRRRIPAVCVYRHCFGKQGEKQAQRSQQSTHHVHSVRSSAQRAINRRPIGSRLR